MVTATEIVRTLVDQGEDIRVTVVPVFTSLTEHCDVENVIKFDRLSIVAYKGEGEVDTHPAPQRKSLPKRPRRCRLPSTLAYGNLDKTLTIRG